MTDWRTPDTDHLRAVLADHEDTSPPTPLTRLLALGYEPHGIQDALLRERNDARDARLLRVVPEPPTAA